MSKILGLYCFVFGLLVAVLISKIKPSRPSIPQAPLIVLRSSCVDTKYGKVQCTYWLRDAKGEDYEFSKISSSLFFYPGDTIQ